MAVLSYREIEVKTILNSQAEQGQLFGNMYTVNLYRGCQHGCIYCDARSKCYGVDNFDKEVVVKTNAVNLLRQALSSKKRKGTVSLGGMNDPYGPVEHVYGLTGAALRVIHEMGFPVHVMTKSDLVLRDGHLLKHISSTYAAVTFSISTPSDTVARKTEPRAPSPSRRFAAMADLARLGVYTGVAMHPVLPFLYDAPEDLLEIIRLTHACGGSYVLPYFGVTLREGNREFFYEALDQSFPVVRFRYEKAFGQSYECMSPRWQELSALCREKCKSYGLTTAMAHFAATPAVEQLQIF